MLYTVVLDPGEIDFNEINTCSTFDLKSCTHLLSIVGIPLPEFAVGTRGEAEISVVMDELVTVLWGILSHVEDRVDNFICICYNVYSIFAR